MSTNKIKELTSIGFKSLRRLNLNENEITAVSWKGHHGVEVLELRKNKLKKLRGVKDLRVCKELYVCENEVTDLRGLENLPVLRRLSLRNNKIKTFMSPFPHLPSLQYLNLRENQLSSIN
jgi:Leucine-rich repeat (LRR) protein